MESSLELHWSHNDNIDEICTIKCIKKEGIGKLIVGIMTMNYIQPVPFPAVRICLKRGDICSAKLYSHRHLHGTCWYEEDVQKIVDSLFKNIDILEEQYREGAV